MGEEGVLLGLVEAVDLIDKEDGLAAACRLMRPGLLDDLADLLDPGEHGRKKDELGLGGVGENGGQRGLARSGRTPEHQRGNTAAVDELAQQLAFSHQVFLADELRKPRRPHPFRQGNMGGRRLHGRGSIPHNGRDEQPRAACVRPRLFLALGSS